jgi:hypothetical protein
MSAHDTYSVGFDFARLNLAGAGAQFTGGITGTVAFTSGLYLHGNIVASGLVDNQTIKPFCNDIAALVANLQLQFSPYSLYYSISSIDNNIFAVNWDGTLGTELRDILGFSGNLSGNSAYTSDKRPKYLIRSIIPNQSKVHAPYEPTGRVNYSESDNGIGYSTYPDQIPIYSEWTQPFETDPGPLDTDWNISYGCAGAPVHKPEDYTDHTKVWWSWEEFYKYTRAHMPFQHLQGVLLENQDGWIYKMRPETAQFDPTRVSVDFDGYWDMKFAVRRITWGTEI